MKHWKFAAAALALTVALSSSAFACTGMYVGKDVSADGTTIVARSEDISPADYNKLQKVQPHVENVPGRFLEDINGFKLPLPDTTYGYTYLSDNSLAGDGLYAAVCSNEMGVSVTGTVSASPCAALKEADPFVKQGGLREAVLPAAVAATSATAKEGVDNLLKFVDTYGSAEGNIVMIADQNEAWIVEIYSGHHYAAMKMPTDAVAVFGNQFMIGAVDPAATEGYVFSDGLFAKLDELKLTVKEDGKVLLAKSVCDKTRSDSSNMRTWIGHTVLAPSSVGEYDTNTFYPLFYKPDQKVSLNDIIGLYRNRYEGTKYDMLVAGNEAMRPIAVSTTPETHIIQIFDDLPAQYSSVTWLAMGGGEHAPFLPVWSGVQSVHEGYAVDGQTYNPNSLYWSFKQICGLADTNRALYSTGVQDFWAVQENAMQAKVLAAKETVKTSADPAAFVTEFSKNAAQEQLKNAKVLYADLLTTLTHNVGLSAAKTPTTFVANVPLRLAAEQKGYTVGYANGVVTLTKGDATYSLTVGSKTATGPQGEVKLTSAPYATGGTTYAPMDFIKGL